MTNQTRYRIVCADGVQRAPDIYDRRDYAAIDARDADAYNDCGPHTVEPIVADPAEVER